jgi:hypothetical protein
VVRDNCRRGAQPFGAPRARREAGAASRPSARRVLFYALEVARGPGFFLFFGQKKGF